MKFGGIYVNDRPAIEAVAEDFIMDGAKCKLGDLVDPSRRFITLLLAVRKVGEDSHPRRAWKKWMQAREGNVEEHDTTYKAMDGSSGARAGDLSEQRSHPPPPYRSNRSHFLPCRLGGKDR
jgi:hypothetical protein